MRPPCLARPSLCNFPAGYLDKIEGKGSFKMKFHSRKMISLRLIIIINKKACCLSIELHRQWTKIIELDEKSNQIEVNRKCNKKFSSKVSRIRHKLCGQWHHFVRLFFWNNWVCSWPRCINKIWKQILVTRTKENQTKDLHSPPNPFLIPDLRRM
jgi:hypothetical protein